MPLPGSVGLGLVLGWLTAGLGGGARGSWGLRLALGAVLLAAGLVTWSLAGGAGAALAAAATAVALLLRLGWHRGIAARPRRPGPRR